MHSVLIAGTLAMPGMSADARDSAREVPSEELVFIVPPEPTAPPAAPLHRPLLAHPPAGAQPLIPLEALLAAAVVDPGRIPDVLPAAGATLAIPFTTGRVATLGRGEASGTGPSSGGRDEPLDVRYVDREVVSVGGVRPRYPAMLASAGVEGTVTLQFVVDTLGRVERGSIRTLRVDQALFEASVREALERMRFTPAEAGGRKVRQLVEQSFSFALSAR